MSHVVSGLTSNTTVELFIEMMTSSAMRRVTIGTEAISDWAARQQNIMPTVNIELVGFEIEMLFQYHNKDGTSSVN